MNTLMIPNAMAGLGKKIEAMLSNATSPENILIDVVPDRSLFRACGFSKNDGVVIDRGLTSPHTGGDCYMIQYDGFRRIRQVAAIPGNQYSVGNDHSSYEVSRDAILVIGKVIGSVTVQTV